MAAAVAERQVSVEFVFERTGETSLAQAYRILVPERHSRSGHKGEPGPSGFSDRQHGATEAEVTELSGDRWQTDQSRGLSVELWAQA
jgi:hypothetical protein